MQVVRQKLIRCPCCNSDFFIRYPDEFYAYPLSEEEKKFVKERKKREDLEGIKTVFIN